MVDLLAMPGIADLAGARFRPRGGRVQRVTFAWLDRGSLQGVPCPDGRASTVVVVWPCDSRGHFLADHVDEAQVLEWRMSRRDLVSVRRWVTCWPLDRHDFYVDGSTITPCWQTLRDADLWVDFRARIERATSMLQA